MLCIRAVAQKEQLQKFFSLFSSLATFAENQEAQLVWIGCFYCLFGLNHSVQ